MSHKRSRELSPLMQLIEDGDAKALKKMLKADDSLFATNETQKEAFLFAFNQQIRSSALVEILFKQCFGSNVLKRLLLILDVYPEIDFLILKSFLPRELTLYTLLTIADCDYEPVRESYCNMWNLRYFPMYQKELRELSKLMKIIDDDNLLKKPFNKICRKIIRLFGQVTEYDEITLVIFFNKLELIYFGEGLCINTWPMPDEDDFFNMPICVAVRRGFFDCFVYLAEHLPNYKDIHDISSIQCGNENILHLACTFNQMPIAKWICEHYSLLLPSLSTRFYSSRILCTLYHNVPLDEKQFMSMVDVMCKDMQTAPEHLDWMFNRENHTLHNVPTNLGLHILRRAIVAHNFVICQYILKNKLVDNDRNSLLERVQVNTPYSSIRHIIAYVGHMPVLEKYDENNNNIFELSVLFSTNPIRELIFDFMKEYFIDYKWKISALFCQSHAILDMTGMLDLLFKYNVKFSYSKMHNLDHSSAVTFQLVWHRHLMKQIDSCLFRFLPLRSFCDDVGSFLFLCPNTCYQSCDYNW